MHRVSGRGAIIAAVALIVALSGAIGGFTGFAIARSMDKAMLVDSSSAQYKEAIPGVSKSSLWGDETKGAYGSFTKFTSDVKNARHTHSSDMHLVVLSGAYIYTPDDGKAVRAGAGSYLFVPAGQPHLSAADPKEGALFYEEAAGKFDIVWAEK